MIGDVPEGFLSDAQREALDTGVSLVIDMFLDDLIALRSGGEFEDTSMSIHVPARFAQADGGGRVPACETMGGDGVSKT